MTRSPVFALPALMVLLALASPALQGQSGETPTVYHLPNGLVPVLKYHGHFNHYVYSQPGVPEPEFPIYCYVPVDPAPNGYAIAAMASGGFVSSADRANDLQYQLDLERQLRPYLQHGYTVFVITHGNVFLQGNPDQPGWVMTEIGEQVHAGVRAIKVATHYSWFSMLPVGQGGHTINPQIDRNRLASTGGSSGGALAMSVYLGGTAGPVAASFPDANIPRTSYPSIDSSTWSASAASTGADLANWRGPGDTAFFWAFLRYLVHPDLSQCHALTVPPPPTPPAYFGVSSLCLYADPTWLSIWNSANCTTGCSAQCIPCGENAQELPYQMATYPPFPNAAIQNQLGLMSISAASLPSPWPRGAYMEFHGDKDDLVPYYQALQLDAATTAAGIPHTFVTLPDEGHGWKDIDLERDRLVISFLDQELRGISDADGDLATTGDPDPNDLDSDGDGQYDGPELAIGTSPSDPTQVFKIVDYEQTRVSTPPAAVAGGTLTGAPAQYYEVTIVFQGVPGDGSAYDIQWSSELPAKALAHWEKQAAVVTPGALINGGTLQLFTAVVGTGVNTTRPANYLRVVWDPPSTFSRVSTDPVAQNLTRIFRPDTGAWWNFIAPSSHRPNVVQNDVATALDDANGLATIRLEGMNSLTDPLNPPNLLPLGPDLQGTTHVLVVMRDASLDRTVHKPEIRGWEGRWWEIVNVLDGSSVQVLRHDAAESLAGLPAGSEIAIRPLSTVRDLFGEDPGGSQELTNVATATGLFGLQVTDRAFLYGRSTATVHGFEYSPAASINRWEALGQPASPCTLGTSTGSFVDGSELRLLPDEGLAFRAVAASSETSESWIVDLGLVPMSDLVAYLEIDRDPVTQQPVAWSSPPGAGCEYGHRRLRSWPYPKDTHLGNTPGDKERPTSGLVESSFAFNVDASTYGAQPSTSHDQIFVADLGDFQAFDDTYKVMAGFEAYFLPTLGYTGDDQSLLLSGNVDPQTETDLNHTRPLQQLWWMSVPPVLGGPNGMEFFVELGDPVMAPRWQIPAGGGTINAGIPGDYPSVLNHLHLRGGRAYELRLGDSHTQTFEWRRRRPYRRPD